MPTICQVFGTVVWVVVALVLAVIVWKVGIALLRGVTTPLPPPPPDGELRKVNLRYRCSICGMELKVTAAGEELPDPPKHCQEEMDLVAPVVE